MKIQKASKPDSARYTGLTHVVRGDFIRLLYSVTLDKLTGDKALELLSLVPLYVDTNQLSPLELVTKIWTHGSMFPAEYANRFVDAFELFCIRNSLDAQQLLTEVFTSLRNGIVLPDRIITRALVQYPMLEEQRADPKEWLLGIFARLCRFSSRNSYCQVIHTASHGNRKSAVVAILFDKLMSNSVPASDLAFWMVSKIRYLPLCINCKPFELVELVADARQLGEVPSDDRVECNGMELLVNGRMVGRTVTFRTFLDSNGISVRDPEFDLDVTVSEVTESLQNSARGRSALHKGCVYGAPVYLFKIGYMVEEKDYKHAIDYCIKNALTQKPVWKSIKAKHHALRRQLSTTYEFEFRSSEGAMYLNASLLARNIPAQILRNLLSNFVHGKKEVERKSLLDDPSIVFDRTNPGIEIRLRRIVEQLLQQAPHLKITRHERGLISIKALCNVNLQILP